MSDLPDGIRVVIPPDGIRVGAPIVLKYSSFLESRTSIVEVAGIDSYTRFAPKGYVSKLKSLTCTIQPVAGATSGNHSLFLQVGGVTFLKVKAAFNKQILITSNVVTSETVETVPLEQSAQALNMQSIGFSADLSFKIVYFNNTNGAQTAIREFQFLIEDTGVV